MENPIELKSPYDFGLKIPNEKTVPEYLLSQAAYFQDKGRKEWITNTVNGETFDFGDIEQKSKSIASALYKRGFRKNDVMLYSSLDGVKAPVFFTGVWRANGQVQLTYAEDAIETQTRKLRESNIRFWACDSANYEDAMSAISKVEWPVELIVLGANNDKETYLSFCDLLQDDGLDCPDLQVTSEDVSFLLATSGTTGESKAAFFTHKQTILNIVQYETQPFNITPEEPALIISKAAHYIGSHIPLSCLTSGKRVLVVFPTNQDNIFRAVHEYKPEGIYSFPKFLLQMVNDVDANTKFDFSSLKIALTAGTVISAAIRETILKLPNVEQVVVFYGMTECGFFTSTLDIELAQNCSEWKNFENLPAGSVGKLGPETNLRVIDVDTGKTLGPNQQGELQFFTPLTCSGYLNKPAESEKTFPCGSILTGDMGYYDENEFIFVVDRIKETFKYNNNHITPSELEQAIASHPSVAEVYVIGVTDPDGCGEIPKAFLTLKNDSCGVTSKQIMEYANSLLAEYKRFRGESYVVILNQMPVGKTGKVSKLLLAQM